MIENFINVYNRICLFIRYNKFRYAHNISGYLHAEVVKDRIAELNETGFQYFVKFSPESDVDL